MRKAMIGRLAAGFVAAASAASEAMAEPATADPGLIAGPRPIGRTIGDFDFGAAKVSFAATGRMAGIDTAIALEDLHDARGMGKFLPGYPQPAFVTFRLHFWL